jgi:hypothetical protein
MRVPPRPGRCHSPGLHAPRASSTLTVASRVVAVAVAEVRRDLSARLRTGRVTARPVARGSDYPAGAAERDRPAARWLRWPHIRSLALTYCLDVVRSISQIRRIGDPMAQNPTQSVSHFLFGWPSPALRARCWLDHRPHCDCRCPEANRRLRRAAAGRTGSASSRPPSDLPAPSMARYQVLDAHAAAATACGMHQARPTPTHPTRSDIRE